MGCLHLQVLVCWVSLGEQRQTFFTKIVRYSFDIYFPDESKRGELRTKLPKFPNQF